jgi:hypothetical protein
MMIDKLEVRVPSQTPYSRDFQKLYSDVRRSKADPFVRSRHYLGVADLRPFGYEAILHAHCVHGTGNHKLELIDTGRETLAEMTQEIERVFDVDSRRLEISRIDLAADIFNVPVPWFLDHVRARWKRFTADIGKIEFSRMGKLGVETFYLGKRPNCYRIYNKVAEFHYQYSRLKVADGDPKPAFEALYGVPEIGAVLTRVERQIGGSRLPAEIGTVRKLRDLAAFDPFANLEILAGAQSTPTVDVCDLSTYLKGRGLQCLVRELGGIHRTRAWLNKYGDGNASRVLRKLGDFLPVADDSLTVERIRGAYRESINKQLAA